MNAYPPPTLESLGEICDASLIGYRIGCLEQILDRFEDSTGAVLGVDEEARSEVEEMLAESRALVTKLRQMFPEVWPTDAILLGDVASPAA